MEGGESGLPSGVRMRGSHSAPGAGAILTRDAFLVLAEQARNWHAPTIERHAAEVASRVGLLHPENHAKFSAFNNIVGYVYPDAPVDRAVACSLWCNWLFFFDDVHDEDFSESDDMDRVRTRMIRYLALLAGMPTAGGPTDPLERLTVEFRARALALAGEEWLSRFCDTTSDYLFLGALPAIQNWRSNRIPSLKEYELQREHDTAVLTTLDLIEVANGVTLPADVLASKDLAIARSACARTIGYFNDIVSYPKEVLRHKNPNNLVHVLMHEKGIDLREALMQASELTNEAASEQLRATNRILARLPEGPHPVRTYLDAMRAWQRGNIDFSLEGQRYSAPWSPLVELTGAAPRAQKEAA